MPRFALEVIEAREPLENDLWYDRFLTWLRMPAPRSLTAVANQDRVNKGKPRGRKASSAWIRAKERFQWERRAREWDAWQREKKEEDRQEEQEAQRQARLRAINKQYERELTASELLYNKAQLVLELPHVEKTVTREVAVPGANQMMPQVVELKPAGASEFNSARKMFESSSNLGRRGLGLPQQVQRLEIDWRAEVQAYGIDPESFYQEVFKAAMDASPPGQARSDNGSGFGGSEPEIEGTGTAVPQLLQFASNSPDR